MPKQKKPPGRRAKGETKRGVIYARYSSHAQKDASIEQQVEECLKFAKDEGITIVETYADRAVSGKSDRRPNFQKMMKDAEKGGFGYVVAWKSNRIGRNMLQAMLNRPPAKLGKTVKITDTSNQRKAKRETMPAVAIAFRENAKPFDKADSVFNQDTFP